MLLKSAKPMSQIKHFFLIGIFGFIGNSIFSQSNFYTKAKAILPVVDSLSPLEISKPSNEKYDYFADSTVKLNTIFNLIFQKQSKSKHGLIQQSDALTILSSFCATNSSSLFSKKGKRRLGRIKRMKRVLYNCKKLMD